MNVHNGVAQPPEGVGSTACGRPPPAAARANFGNRRRRRSSARSPRPHWSSSSGSSPVTRRTGRRTVRRPRRTAAGQGARRRRDRPAGRTNAVKHFLARDVLNVLRARSSDLLPSELMPEAPATGW